MKGDTRYDIKDATFDEFVCFLFEHPVVPRSKEPGAKVPWYCHAQVEYDSVKTAQYYIRLFSSPEFLVEKYTPEQLEQGFWAIPSCNLDCSVQKVIWDGSVPLETRKECIRSMYHLYEKLFQEESLSKSSDMWWDAIAYDYDCDNRKRSRGGEERIFQDVMFEALKRILQIDNKYCQWGALHGLGHLHHPETENVIAKFLEDHPGLDANLRDYAKGAIKGDIM